MKPNLLTSDVNHSKSVRDSMCLHVVVLFNHQCVQERRLALALASLAETIHRAQYVRASWYDPESNRASEFKSKSLGRHEQASTERLMTLSDRTTTGATGISIVGNAAEMHDDPPWSYRWLVSTTGAAEGCSHTLPFSANLSIRFPFLVADDATAWRVFSRKVIDIVTENGGHGCGIVEVAHGRKWNYGTALVGLTCPQTFDQAVAWNKWCLSVKTGIDKVPWATPGAVLSLAAVEAVGGLDALKSELKETFDYPFTKRDEPLVEAVSGGGAIVWLAPEFQNNLPAVDGDDQVDMSIAADRGAQLHLALQRLGLAL